MNITKLSKRGQVVIPKKIREMTGLNEGDIIKFTINNKKIILEKIETNENDSLVDFLKKGKPFQKDLIKKLREEWE